MGPPLWRLNQLVGGVGADSRVLTPGSRATPCRLAYLSASWIKRGVAVHTLRPRQSCVPQGFMSESPSTPILKLLRRLDESSPNFHDLLSNVLYGEEYQGCVSNLHAADVKWLVEYLDRVRRCIILPRPPLEQA